MKLDVIITGSTGMVGEGDFMKPAPGQRNVNPGYHYIGWFYPLGRVLFSGGFFTIQEAGRAMVNAASKGAPKLILEVKDIVALS